MILDGFTTAQVIRTKISEEVSRYKDIITLAILMVGKNQASQIYVRNKEKACEEVGIKTKVYQFDENISQKEVLKMIDECNKDDSINGILVQLPLPGHINEEDVLDRIDPKKDVDGLNLVNQGKLALGKKCIEPATARGVITLLKNNNIELYGKNVVVIGRSKLVGKPLALLMLQENATVTVCHSKTQNLKDFTKKADIICIAIGQPKFLTGDMIKRDSVIVDVGINRVAGTLCGDVDFDDCKEIASYITPVPKGVGPMTIATLLQNVLKCYKIQKNLLD